MEETKDLMVKIENMVKNKEEFQKLERLVNEVISGDSVQIGSDGSEKRITEADRAILKELFGMK